MILIGQTKNFRLLKFPLFSTILFGLIFGFLCVGMFHKTSMTMESMDPSAMLSVKGEQTCCGGNMSQHIQSWTNTFLTIPQDLRNNLALLALGFLLALVFIKSLFSYTTTDQRLLVDRLYLRQRPNLLVFNPLKLAFSRGILHPKLY